MDFEDDIRFALPQREAGAGESVTRDVLIYELHDTRYFLVKLIFLLMK